MWFGIQVVVQGTRIEGRIRWPASTRSRVGMKNKRGGRPDPFVEDPLLAVFICDWYLVCDRSPSMAEKGRVQHRMRNRWTIKPTVVCAETTQNRKALQQCRSDREKENPIRRIQAKRTGTDASSNNPLLLLRTCVLCRRCSQCQHMPRDLRILLCM
jgi:hypothetical protein